MESQPNKKKAAPAKEAAMTRRSHFHVDPSPLSTLRSLHRGPFPHLLYRSANPGIPSLMNTLHYTLKSRMCEGVRRFCWMTDDGVPLSPEFRSTACAQAYAEKMPMITDEEWEEYRTPASFDVPGKLHEWNTISPL